MFNIDREELKMEIEGELARLAPQAGRGYRVRALVVHPYCDPIVAWVPTDYAAVYCIVGGPPGSSEAGDGGGAVPQQARRTSGSDWQLCHL